MTKDLSAGQEKNVDKSRKMFVGTALLAALWVLLSLFALPCTGAEAAVKPEAICGVHDINIIRKSKTPGDLATEVSACDLPRMRMGRFHYMQHNS